MTEIEFKALAAQGYNRIPLVAETYADLDTPLGIYLKLAHAGPQAGRMTCLMESVVGGERFGRYSFIGLPARTVIRASGTRTEVLHDGKVSETHDGDPLAFIEQYQARFKVALRPGMPRFCGGLAGYFGYDTVRHIEALPGPGGQALPGRHGRRHAGPDADARGRAGHRRQPGRPHLPDGLRRPGPARGLQPRPAAPARPARAAATPGGNPVQPRQHADRGTA